MSQNAIMDHLLNWLSKHEVIADILIWIGYVSCMIGGFLIYVSVKGG